MRRAWWVVAVVLAMPAHAQTVFRCVAKNGKVTLQSRECPISQKQTWKYYEPLADDPYVAAQTRAVQREMDRRNQRSSRAVTYTIPNKPSEAQRRAAECSDAKLRRQRTLDQVGMRRTYALLSQLDAQVYKACQGR